MSSLRTIAVLTTGRQDWGILRSTAEAIRAHPALRLHLVVGGTHLSDLHGHTLDEVLADGFQPDAFLGWVAERPDDASPSNTEPADTPADSQAARALDRVGSELRASKPDALVLVGDRFETAAAALAATINRVAIVHLHGGEQTSGAFDDALRHAITKLAHLHLVSSEEHARRVIALGEDAATVSVVGAPGIDALYRQDVPDRQALAADLGIALARPVVVVTVHPTTLALDPAGAARAVAAAMDRVPATYIVTMPNADPGSGEVRALMMEATHLPQRVAVEALGSRRYVGLMRIADALLGNSSSAIVEAPALGLPVVDVGDRQAGRQREANVIWAAETASAVEHALRRALDPAFRAALAPIRAPLVDGRAGERIAAIIAEWHPPDPLRKAPIMLPDRPA